jgi:hypothetical protein
MAPIHRILIKTHHMTSRKKILAITKAAKRLSCSVLLKTGGPPGVMIAEGESGPALEWLEVVRVSHPHHSTQPSSKEPFPMISYVLWLLRELTRGGSIRN